MLVIFLVYGCLNGVVAHPGHAHLYPEEVSSSSGSSSVSSQSTPHSSSSKYSTSKYSSSSKSSSSSSSKSSSSSSSNQVSPTQSNSPNQQSANEVSDVNGNDSGINKVKNESISVNNTTVDDNNTINSEDNGSLTLNDYIVMILVFILGFGVMILFYEIYHKYKRSKN